MTNAEMMDLAKSRWIDGKDPRLEVLSAEPLVLLDSPYAVPIHLHRKDRLPWPAAGGQRE